MKRSGVEVVAFLGVFFRLVGSPPFIWAQPPNDEEEILADLISAGVEGNDIDQQCGNGRRPHGVTYKVCLQDLWNTHESGIPPKPDPENLPPPSLSTNLPPAPAGSQLENWGVTADVFTQAFMNPSCMAFRLKGCATCPPAFVEGEFWMPTYYIEVVTEREKSLLFPPYSTKVFEAIADAVKLESAKKAVFETIGKAANLKEKVQSAISGIFSAAMSSKARTVVNQPSEKGTQYREVHVWKYKNPTGAEEFFQTVLCVALAYATGAKVTAHTNKGRLSPTDLAKSLLIFPGYFTEVDFVQWNTGLFDLSFGESLGMGKRLVWQDSNQKEQANLSAYSRKGLHYEANPTVASLNMAIRAFSRASDAMMGGVVDTDVLADPGNYKFNVIYPNNPTNCFRLDSSNPNRLSANLPSSLQAGADDYFRADYALLAWEKRGKTELLNECMKDIMMELPINGAAKYAASYVSCNTGCAGSAAGVMPCTIACTATATSTLVSVEIAANVALLINEIYRFIQDVRKAVEFIMSLIDEVQTWIQRVKFAKTVATMAGQALGEQFAEGIKVKCDPGSPGDPNAIPPVPPVAPEDPAHCAIRNGAPEACDDLFGGTQPDREGGTWMLDTIGGVFDWPADQLAALFSTLPATAALAEVQILPATPGDTAGLTRMCLDACPGWCPTFPATPTNFDPWSGCVDQSNNPTLTRVARERICDVDTATITCADGSIGTGYLGTLRQNVKDLLATASVKPIPSELDAKSVIQKCQANWERHQEAERGKAMLATVTDQAMEQLAPQYAQISGCVPVGRPAKGREVAKCVEDAVFKDIIKNGKDAALAQPILNALPSLVKEPIERGMDLVRDGKQTMTQIAGDPTNPSAPKHALLATSEEWVTHERDHKKWVVSGKKGTEPPQPASDQPKDACGFLAAGGQHKSEAWAYMRCDVADVAQRREVSKAAPSPYNPFCHGETPAPGECTGKTQPNPLPDGIDPNDPFWCTKTDPLWCVPPFDYTESLVECSGTGDIQPSGKGIPYSMFDQYLEILKGFKGSGKGLVTKGECEVQYCTDRGTASKRHKLRARKCAWVTRPDGSPPNEIPEFLCTCTGFPDKYDINDTTADPTAQDHASGILYGGKCNKHPAAQTDSGTYTLSIPPECEPSCPDDQACAEEPKQYRCGGDDANPISCDCPSAVDPAGTSKRAAFTETPPPIRPDWCVWQ